MLAMWERQSEGSANRFSDKTILFSFQTAAFFALLIGLLSCGSSDQIPSNSGSSAPQNISAAVKNPVKTIPNQNATISSAPEVQPSPEVQQIISRHALYLSDLKYPKAGIDPQEQEERSQRQEVLSHILNEPDPEMRRILMTWSKSTLEDDPEAIQILNELKSYDGDDPNTGAIHSKGSLDSPEMNTTAGETGG